MVTVLNLDTEVSMCLDEGAIDYIAKPFSNLVLRARVRAVLQNRRHMDTVEDVSPTYRPRKDLTGLVDLYFYELTLPSQRAAGENAGSGRASNARRHRLDCSGNSWIGPA